MILKFILISVILFLFTGCQRYYSFDTYQKNRLSEDKLNTVSEKEMCNMISKNNNSWIEEKQKCLNEITNEDINNLLSFKNKCEIINAKVKIEHTTLCRINDDLKLVYDENSFNKLDYLISLKYSLKAEAEKYNTIKELCLEFKNTIYNEKNRSCEFIDNKEISEKENSFSKYMYSNMEEIVRKKDNQAYKNEQIEKDNIKNWETEAKNWKGSLDDLCEYLTDSKNNFDEKTLGCKTYWKREIKKYEIMKPFLVEQHQKIREERNKILTQKLNEEREKELQIKIEWEKRIGKSQEIIGAKNFILGDKSFICESYKSYLFFFPKKIKLDIGLDTIQINNSMLFNYVDVYKDYFLYQGYDKNYKIINLKIYREALLKTTPYSLDIDGLGYYCDLVSK